MTVRGVDLAYEMSGTGPTLVWGHGLTSNMARDDAFEVLDWPTVRHVARVLRYDARRHGESESTADPIDHHWRNLDLDQLALADAVGVGSYIAGGASLGCATALHAALLAPERVTALLLAIPPRAWETRGAAIADLPPPEAIARLQIPTMILAWTGDPGDPGDPMTTADRLVELMPHAELVIASTFDELVGWTSEAMSFLATLPR